MDKNVGAQSGPSKRIKISGPDETSEDVVSVDPPAKSKPAKSIKITSFDDSAVDNVENVEVLDKPVAKTDKKAAKAIKITAPEESEESTDDLSMDEVNNAPAPEKVAVAADADEFLEEPEPVPVSKPAKVAVSSAAVKPNAQVQEPAPQPAEPEPEEHIAQVHPPAQASVASVRNSSPIPPDPPVDTEEQDVFEAASRESETDAEPDYSQYTALRKPKKNWKKVLLWILVALFAIGGVAAGGYVLMKQKNSSPNIQLKQNNNSSGPGSVRSGNSNNNQQQNQSAPGTKDYTSSNLQVSFSYPEKWTVDDTSGSKLTVTSPMQKLTDASGQPQDVKIIMRIEKQDAADMSDFKKGDAAAVLQSEKIDYDKPTGTQRANTYISFVQYSTTTTKGALDGIYVTGNLGYTYAQAIKETDIAKIDPLVRVVFVKCADTNCTNSSETNISSDEWKNKDFSQPITDMFKSLSFQ
ncbi:MAG TPA: hypothetical protein VLG47_07450 [Candidatus Saccharimonadales bacterium]|nr:hypothetical protein [Candidatus Saccharimonadales bacterium]